MIEFRKANPNPAKKITTDCVIRAISIAENKTWDEIYDELVKIGKRIKVMPNDDEAIQDYLKKYEMIVPKVIKGEKRLTALELGKGTFILKQAHHLVCVKDKKLFDLHDTRLRAVYRYWRVK